MTKNRIKILPKWRILQLYPLAFNGDRVAFEELFWSVYGTILTFVKKYKHNSSEEITEQAMYGFVRGVANGRWNPSKGNFNTYIRFYIEGEILCTRRRDTGLIHFPVLKTNNPDNPKVISIELLHGFDAQEKEHHVQRMEEHDQRRWRDVRQMMSILGGRDMFVLEERFLKGRTLESLALELGVSRERVRQIQLHALYELKEALA